MRPSDSIYRLALRITNQAETASTEAIALAGIQLAEEIVALLSEPTVKEQSGGWYTATSGVIPGASER